MAEFVEVETGKGADALDKRPQLAALAEAKQHNCPVAVASLTGFPATYTSSAA